MHLPTLKWTSSFLYETIARKKDIRKTLLLRKNVKYKDVKRKPVFSEPTPNLFLYIQTYIGID